MFLFLGVCRTDFIDRVVFVSVDQNVARGFVSTRMTSCVENHLWSLAIKVSQT